MGQHKLLRISTTQTAGPTNSLRPYFTFVVAVALGAVLCVAGLWFLKEDRQGVNRQTILSDVQVSICDVIGNSDIFANRVVHVQTTIDAWSDGYFAGDERCVTAHPLVDVEISRSAIDRICALDDENSARACWVLGSSGETNHPNFAIKGVFAGTVNSYVPSTKSFTHNGNRFRFTVTDIVSIEETIEPATFKPE